MLKSESPNKVGWNSRRGSSNGKNANRISPSDGTEGSSREGAPSPPEKRASRLPMSVDASSHASTALSLIVLTATGAGGLMVGAVKARGIRLGSAGVLFAGLAAGACGWKLDAEVLDFVREFGLMLFVFTMGLQLGPGFFASLKQAGLRLNALALGVVLSGFLCAWLTVTILDIAPGAAPGLLSGATTNTPSLGAARQAMAAVGAPADQMALPALAYSAAYPVGIIGIILSLMLLRSIFGIDARAEAGEFEERQRSGAEPLQRLNVVMDNPHLDGLPIRELPGRRETGVMISRIHQGDAPEVMNATEETILHLGDRLLLVGTPRELVKFQRIVGQPGDFDLMTAPGEVSFRRVVVTNKKVLGQSLSQLGFDHLYGVTITRIVRAGLEMTAVPDIRLQIGDFLHVVGDKKSLDQAATALGDSLKDLNTTHFIPVFVGLAVGILAGMIPLHVPGLSSPLKLGLAGGPLLVAILLSRLGKLGPLVWHMPANTNMAFRELGMVLFLACVGLSAGPKFVSTVMSHQGLIWMTAALAITTVPLLIFGIIGRRCLQMNFLEISGLLSGSMTDPPALAFANNLAGSEAASIAYATVYPLTMLCRIVVAQVMVLLLFR